MPGDVASGRYPLINPHGAAIGLQGNAAQANLLARSNLAYTGFSGLADTAAALVSGKVTLVAIPVQVGDEIQFVDIIVGATAAETPTHSWAALYSSSGSLLGAQSTDGGEAAIAASKRFTFTLGSKYIVQPADVGGQDGGCIYAGLSVTATKVPSLAAVSIAAAVGYQRFTGAPTFYAANSGAGLGAKAPASVELSAASIQAGVPEVYLR
jgi:hypothetical protein